ncbi:uncharacterized protein BDZ99DRAFT_522905 [Mytilinidion resinicola]|uniref:Uncharacterized protein n=1 Tax=Mytilinidion resinicola TaxID=574789 RepID=A0A6A6YEX9_9PEZI|nr:uncharacterized protein BDZ99DRAFT_522905 [Mytilinidion resinicola]KAF2807290.1 hypothetical protein BDZ99DRAFT_522905 [Mytilinidion resinicola]
MHFHGLGLGLSAVTALWAGGVAGAAIPGTASTEAVQGVNAILRFYRDTNFRGQWWYGGADDAMGRCFAAPCEDCVSSIQFTGDSHRAAWCTFYDHTGCVALGTPLYTSENIANLGAWNYNDRIKSFQCWWQ